MSRVLPDDYDRDPGRFAANVQATGRFLARQDIPPDVAERVAAEGSRRIADIGGGTGRLAPGPPRPAANRSQARWGPSPAAWIWSPP